jgi:hypothetical protein
LHAQICFEAAKARSLEDTRAVILPFVKLPSLNTYKHWSLQALLAPHGSTKQQGTRL